MITGFNTDIEHDGVVYHVQTEDKGMDTPLILSLVYSGGAILASKRSRYEDLIASGFSDEALSERLSRQHRLICAAIHAGRLEDLKRMSAASADAKRPVAAEPPPPSELEILRGDEEREVQEAAADSALPSELEILRGDEEREAMEAERVSQGEKDRIAREAEKERQEQDQDALDTTQEILKPPPGEIASPLPLAPPVDEVASYQVNDQRRQTVMGDVFATDNGLRITILGKQEFRSGSSPTLKVMVGLRSGSQEQPVAKAAVSVKVLGTTFRPQIYSAKTHSDGVAVITAQIPTFTSGRAAILIKAVASGKETELRRIILPA